jgi:hypothetical protein
MFGEVSVQVSKSLSLNFIACMPHIKGERPHDGQKKLRFTSTGIGVTRLVQLLSSPALAYQGI